MFLRDLFNIRLLLDLEFIENYYAVTIKGKNIEDVSDDVLRILLKKIKGS